MSQNWGISISILVFSLFFSSCDPNYKIYLDNRTSDITTLELTYKGECNRIVFYKKLLEDNFELNRNDSVYVYSFPIGKTLIGGGNLSLPHKDMPLSKIRVFKLSDTIVYNSTEINNSIRLEKNKSFLFVID